MPTIKYELWEADEYVITIDGGPVGQTLSKVDAFKIYRWLKTAIKDIQQSTENIET